MKWNLKLLIEFKNTTILLVHLKLHFHLQGKEIMAMHVLKFKK